MVRAVYDATGNSTLLETAYEALQTEHAYWTSPPKIFTVAVPGGTFKISRYYAEWDQPRPESFLCGPVVQSWSAAVVPCCSPCQQIQQSAALGRRCSMLKALRCHMHRAAWQAGCKRC